MKKFYALILISLIGIGYGIYEVIQFQKPNVGSAKALPAFTPPFVSYVAALGVVEPASWHIPVGTQVSGVVTKLFVHEGQNVKTGDPLFAVDSRDLELNITEQKTRVDLARARLKRAEDRYAIARELWEKSVGTISKKDYETARDNVFIAKKRLESETVTLKMLEHKLNLYTVRSPIDGIVLQNDLRPGMYMEAASTTPPYLQLGSKRFDMIAEVDELLAPKIRNGAEAVAFVRGDPTKKVTLQFVRIRPKIGPKTLFAHTPLERHDAKVMQVVYRIVKSDVPLYAGEIFDIYIEAP